MGLHIGDSSDDDDLSSAGELASGSESGIDHHQRARVEREFEKVTHPYFASYFHIVTSHAIK